MAGGFWWVKSARAVPLRAREDEQIFRVIAEAMPYPLLLIHAAEQKIITAAISGLVEVLAV